MILICWENLKAVRYTVRNKSGCSDEETTIKYATNETKVS